MLYISYIRILLNYYLIKYLIGLNLITKYGPFLVIVLVPLIAYIF